MDRPKICWVCGGVIAEPMIEKLGTPITELKLSKRASNCLYRASIEYIEQLIKLDRKELLRLRNLGEHTAKELQDKIKAVGFDWDI